MWALAQLAAAASFVGGSALRALHDFLAPVVLESMEAESANDALGERATFRPGVQGPGGHDE